MDPYETPTSQPNPNVTPSDIQPYFFAQGVMIYVVSCSLLWLLVAPLIAPTDFALEGAPAVPTYLIAIQVVLCYGGPGLLVYWDWLRQCRTAR